MGGKGSTSRKGYVEDLNNNGKWRGVCDDFFDIEDADVICKMLNFDKALRALKGFQHTYGKNPSKNKFILDDLQCNGNENSIFDCPHVDEDEHDCSDNEIAAVECTSKLLNFLISSSFCVLELLGNASLHSGCFSIEPGSESLCLKLRLKYQHFHD